MRTLALVAIVTGTVSLGCSSPATPGRSTSPAEVAASPKPQPTSPPSAPTLPPLTAEELRWVEPLRRDILALTQVGARNIDDPLALADAIDWLSTRLTDEGLAVQRQGFSHGDEVQQNLLVRFPGLRLGNQSIVVGARLDSALGSPGADDNASGAAVLLCLARRFKDQRHLRTLDIVWFTDASGRRDRAASGASAYVEAAKKDETRSIRAMLELNGVGVYSSEPNSQRYDETLVHGRSVGDFVGFLSYPEHAQIAGGFRHALETQGSLPLSRFVVLSDASPVPDAAHTEFLRAGIPAMMLYDTHALRNPRFGGPRDTAEDLDYQAMARLVEGVGRALLELTGPAGQAPVTPHGYGSPGEEASRELHDPPNDGSRESASN